MDRVKELQLLFEAYLRRQKFDRDPSSLYQPFNYILRSPAKRLRPLMVMLAGEMFGESARKVLSQAFAVELFHNFSLIHDDIMDQAPLRRGKKTIHKKFGETTAILSGDVMLVYAYDYLMQADDKLIPQLLQAFNACAIKVCEGQQLDMNFEQNSNVRVKDYMKMIELKTATLIATSLWIGSIMGGAPEKDSRSLYQFGRELGICFQLKDDWLDAFGESKRIGKRKGGDIIQNKKTFLILEALRRADQKTGTKLRELYKRTHLNPLKKLASVLDLFEKIGIDKITEDAINKHFEKALDFLRQIQIPEKKKLILKSLANDLLTREN